MNPEQCAAFRQGLEEFNQDRYFACHETLEGIWLQLEGAEKRFMQGLIQVAAACHHWSRGNFKGALSLMQAGAAKIQESPQPWIEQEAFLEHIRLCLAALRENPAAPAPRYRDLRLQLID